MGKWVPKFSASFQANVWNIHPYSDRDLLLELRNSEESLLQFFVLSLDTCSLHEFSIQDPPWFSQVVHAAHGLILFHVFQDSENPDRVTLKCYRQGKEIWEKEGARFLGAYDTDYLIRTADGETISVNTNTGEKSEQTADFTSMPETIDIPVHYRQEDDHFEEVAIYIRTVLGAQPVRAIDYSEQSGRIFMSYYKSSANGMLELDLIVLDGNGDTLLYENLGKDLSGIADPPFLFYRGNLIFVKEKRHFFVYAVPTDN